MKRIIFTATMLASLFALSVSCQDENEFLTGNEETVANNYDGNGFLLIAEGFAPTTKTVVSGNSVNWVNADEVNLNGSNYAITLSEDKATVNADLSGASAIYGYYPSNIAVSNGQTASPTVAVPASYASSTDADGNQVIALPMAAYRNSGGNWVEFKHLTAAVNVMVWNATAATLYIDSVTITADEYRLNGERTLDLTAADYGITADNTSVPAVNRTVTVKFAIPMAIEPGSANAKSIQVPILPIGADSLTVSVASHNTKYPGVSVNDQTHTFKYKSTSAALGRNYMLTARVKMDPSSANVSSNGAFSVSADKAVYFSQGMLQFCARTYYYHNREWRFADSDWDFADKMGFTVSSVYNDSSSAWIDLFGYGTSGYDNGQKAYQPWATDGLSEEGTYPDNYPYLKCNLTGNMDWGYNAITNGGNTENSGWRTPSAAEWDYILNQRPGVRYAPARIPRSSSTYHEGYILFPDNWDTLTYKLSQKNYNNLNSLMKDNTITQSDWNTYFKPNGAVFLVIYQTRTTGQYGTISNTTNATYWTSTWGVSQWTGHPEQPFIVSSYEFKPLQSSLHETRTTSGYPVRLVRDAN